jgi:hypothetical protein
VKELFSALVRPGDDLLSHALRRTIIGPEELNDRVRNGIGWGLFGIATRSYQRRVLDIVLFKGESKRAHHHAWEGIKPNELLVPVSSMARATSTPGLSTSWSTTALQGSIVLRWVSRLDAFSVYPFRT